MNNWLKLIPALATLTISLSANASLIVSLATVDNLTALPVGASINVRIELTGLNAGEELDALAASVSFPASLFNTPNISPGGIIPDPLDDPLDVLVVEDAGLADLTFLTLGVDTADHITTNGVFFEFAVNALQQGAGEFTFTFGGATFFNSADPGAPIDAELETGAPLPFIIVPEPASSSLLLLNVLLIFVRQTSGRLRL